MALKEEFSAFGRGSILSHPNFTVILVGLPSSLCSFSSFPPIIMLKIGFFSHKTLKIHIYLTIMLVYPFFCILRILYHEWMKGNSLDIVII